MVKTILPAVDLTGQFEKLVILIDKLETLFKDAIQLEDIGFEIFFAQVLEVSRKTQVVKWSVFGD